jgi:hypothetical protein
MRLPIERQFPDLLLIFPVRVRKNSLLPHVGNLAANAFCCRYFSQRLKARTPLETACFYSASSGAKLLREFRRLVWFQFLNRRTHPLQPGLFSSNYRPLPVRIPGVGSRERSDERFVPLDRGHHSSADDQSLLHAALCDTYRCDDSVRLWFVRLEWS